jgi:hypothetical protein
MNRKELKMNQNEIGMNHKLKSKLFFNTIFLKSNQNSMRSCLMDECIIKYYVNEVNAIRKALLFYRRPALLAQGSSHNQGGTNVVNVPDYSTGTSFM